jgi:hypothetical protein
VEPRAPPPAGVASAPARQRARSFARAPRWRRPGALARLVEVVLERAQVLGKRNPSWTCLACWCASAAGSALRVRLASVRARARRRSHLGASLARYERRARALHVFLFAANDGGTGGDRGLLLRVADRTSGGHKGPPLPGRRCRAAGRCVAARRARHEPQGARRTAAAAPSCYIMPSCNVPPLRRAHSLRAVGVTGVRRDSREFPRQDHLLRQWRCRGRGGSAVRCGNSGVRRGDGGVRRSAVWCGARRECGGARHGRSTRCGAPKRLVRGRAAQRDVHPALPPGSAPGSAPVRLPSRGQLVQRSFAWGTPYCTRPPTLCGPSAAAAVSRGLGGTTGHCAARRRSTAASFATIVSARERRRRCREVRDRRPRMRMTAARSTPCLQLQLYCVKL